MTKNSKNWLFFPGCSLTEGFGADYHISNEACLKELEDKLDILEDWNCCGSVYLTNYTGGTKASTGLGALNIAKATKTNSNLVIGCSECNRKLLRAKYYLKNDKEVNAEITEFLKKDSMQMDLDTKLYHLLDYYQEIIGIEKVKEHINTPLQGIKVYPYVGCLYSRPKRYHEEDDIFRDPEKPQQLGTFLEALGCDVTFANFLTECCGASCVLTRDEMADDMLQDIFDDAEAMGADTIVTVCPMCKFNLDARQGKLNIKRKIPVLQFTQLMGLAFGIKPNKLGLSGNITSIKPLINKIKFLKKMDEDTVESLIRSR